MNTRSDTEAAATMATLIAAVIMAHQLAGKTTRDVLFLAGFSPDALPSLVTGAALFSIILAVPVSRGMTVLGPARLVPALFAASGVLHLLEWVMSFRFPRPVTVLLYCHFAGFGGVLISGFWSMVNERFDPHTAKRRMAGIGSAATLGGLFGGGVASALKASAAMLPVLAAMHLICAWMLPFLGRGTRPDGPVPANGGPGAGIRLLGRHPYLRNVALLVFAGASGATLLGFVFIARCAGIAPDRRPVFFALFYAVPSVITFLIQTTATRALLERRGLGVTAAVQPVTVTLGAVGAAMVPGVGAITCARGSEQVIRNSYFRSANELFYTPLPPAEKRAAKPLIDVGVERLGDMAGGAAFYVLHALRPVLSQPLMLAAAAIAGLTGLWTARRLDRGYVAALENSLRHRGLGLALADVTDRTTRATLIRTMTGVQTVPTPPVTRSRNVPGAIDPIVRRIADLRSGNPARVKRALAEEGLGPGVATHAIALLGWDEIANDAARALRRAGAVITGQLVDALLDPTTEFAIRRRIPRVLGGLTSARAAEGLLLGLEDKRFEVRYRCGRALASMSGNDAGPDPGEAAVYQAVSRELEVDKHLWESYRLLDGGDEDQLVGDRADRGLEHVFNLLSIVLPKEPLRISLAALHTEDEMLRGTALEYLETVLPPAVQQRLGPLLDDQHSTKEHAPRSRDEVLAALLQSHDSIQSRLMELRARKRNAAAGIRE